MDLLGGGGRGARASVVAATGPGARQRDRLMSESHSTAAVDRAELVERLESLRTRFDEFRGRL
jgi:hypothetical protein